MNENGETKNVVGGRGVTHESALLKTPLARVPGVGERRAGLLEKLGLYTLRDLLYDLPRDYKDFSSIAPVAALEAGECCALLRLSTEARIAFPRKGLSIVSAQANDETGGVKIVWYNQPYRKKQLEAGKVYLVYGRLTERNGRKTFENPDIEAADKLGEGEVNPRGLLPVYSLTAGVGQATIRTAASACLAYAKGKLEETLPVEILEEYGLLSLPESVETVHKPADWETLRAARHRLGVEEGMLFLLAVEVLSAERKRIEGIAFRTEGLLEAYLQKLPFEVTDAQRKVLREIEADMAAGTPMNRLVQGDVGAGKTVLAFFALYVAVQNGYQAAIMAPTEILAKQHDATARKIFGPDCAIDLLVGALTPKQKREAVERLASGETQIAIGTHALIQEGVAFQKLGVVVADEQHRFGVRQRAALSRGGNADVLIMSATPIPRTLTLILYGDLDVSILQGAPPGRKPVLTREVAATKRRDMYEFVKKQAQNGRQTYVVCPLVDASEAIDAKSAEEIYKELSTGLLADVPMALLHGRMNAEQKDAVIEGFRAGRVMVLVSTTVIEVGVDVPNACFMIIENADRFGLAQLHQLRGRVGRGREQSWCFLLNGSASPTAAERLDILVKSSDGFEIAQKDLALRGPGEFLGTRQSGAGAFKMLRIVQDMDSLELARALAKKIAGGEISDAMRDRLMKQARDAYVNQWRDIARN